jgi:hypothetical protein
LPSQQLPAASNQARRRFCIGLLSSSSLCLSCLFVCFFLLFFLSSFLFVFFFFFVSMFLSLFILGLLSSSSCEPQNRDYF